MINKLDTNKLLEKINNPKDLKNLKTNEAIIKSL